MFYNTHSDYYDWALLIQMMQPLHKTTGALAREIGCGVRIITYWANQGTTPSNKYRKSILTLANKVLSEEQFSAADNPKNLIRYPTANLSLTLMLLRKEFKTLLDLTYAVGTSKCRIMQWMDDECEIPLLTMNKIIDLARVNLTNDQLKQCGIYFIEHVNTELAAA